jgi:hypothetical protein
MTFSNQLILYIKHWQIPLKQLVSYVLIIPVVIMTGISFMLDNSGLQSGIIVGLLVYLVAGLVFIIFFIPKIYNNRSRMIEKIVIVHSSLFDNMPAKKRLQIIKCIDDMLKFKITREKENVNLQEYVNFLKAITEKENNA